MMGHIIVLFLKLTLLSSFAMHTGENSEMPQWGHEYPQINPDFCCLFALQAPPKFVVLALGSLYAGCRLIHLECRPVPYEKMNGKRHRGNP